MATTKKKDWYPDGRRDQLDYCKNWIRVMSEPIDGVTPDKQKWKMWGIPEDVFVEFGELYAAADDAFKNLVASGGRGGVLGTAVDVALEELEAAARILKQRYLSSPPLTRVDLDALNIKEKDHSRTPKPRPSHAPAMKIGNPDSHEVSLLVTDSPDEDISDLTFNIRMGIFSPDGKIPERSITSPYYMTRTPVIPEDIPGQFNRRRRKETFLFTAAESGMRVYFCICYQNAKGETGPWSEIITGIIT